MFFSCLLCFFLFAILFSYIIRIFVFLQLFLFCVCICMPICLFLSVHMMKKRRKIIRKFFLILDLESHLQRCQQLSVTGRKHFNLKVIFIFSKEKYFWDISLKVEIISSRIALSIIRKSISLWMLHWFYSIFKGIQHV